MGLLVNVRLVMLSAQCVKKQMAELNFCRNHSIGVQNLSKIEQKRQFRSNFSL